MSDHTRLAAVAFDDDIKNYRVYYQDSENRIQESCYDDKNGWYMRDFSVVATNAKKGTPLAATTWSNGREIRVYYMTTSGQLVEVKWSVSDSRDVGFWESSIDLKATKPDLATQLAVACTETGNDGFQVQLLYQSANQELRRTSFNSSGQGEWVDTNLNAGSSPISIPRGNGFGITSSGTTRIFYQGKNRELHLLQESGRNWKTKKLGEVKFYDKTPIAAISTTPSSDSDESNINIFFVSRDKKLLHKVFQPKDDKFVAAQSGTSQPSTPPGEAVRGLTLAAVMPNDDETCIFFPSGGASESPLIAQYNLEGAERFVLGIPTIRPGGAQESRTAPTKLSKLDEEMGMLGLVRRQIVDSMDESTKKEFIERIKSTVKVVIAQSYTANGFPGEKSQAEIDRLSRDFRLGFGWEGQGGQGGYWKNRNYNESSALMSHSNPTLQMEGFIGTTALYQGTTQTQGRLNTYLYADTLYRLCRYLKIDS